MAKVTIDTSICKGCGLCVHVCPKKVLELNVGVLNEKGYHPAIEARQQDCIGCAMCAVICPDCAIVVEK